MPTNRFALPERLPVAGRHQLESVRDAVDFYDVKGFVENLLELLHIRSVSWVADVPEPTTTPEIMQCQGGRERIGHSVRFIRRAGELRDREAGLRLELDFEKLVTSHSKAHHLCAFPLSDSTRDIAMLAGDDVQAEQLSPA